MTSEKMFSVVCDMIRQYGIRDDSADFAEEVIKTPHKYSAVKEIRFYSDAAAILVDCLSGMDKKTTKAGQLSAIKRFLADDDRRPIYQKALWTGDKLVMTDGYKMLVLDRDLDSLPHVNTEKDGQFMNYEKAIAPARDYARSNDVLLQVPTVAELKAFCAAHGVTRRSCEQVPYILDSCVCVNPFYLMDALQAVDNIRIYKPESYSRPVYFCGDGAEGIILPVRPKAEIASEIEKAYISERERKAIEEKENQVKTLEEIKSRLSWDGNIEVAEKLVASFRGGHARYNFTLSELQDLVRREREAQEDQEEREKAADRIEAVAIAVSVSEDDKRMNDSYIRQYKRGSITEDEAKRAIIYPVSAVNRYALALPAPSSAAVSDNPAFTVTDVEIIAVNPAAVAVPAVSAAFSHAVTDTGDDTGDNKNDSSGETAKRRASASAARDGSSASSVASTLDQVYTDTGQAITQYSAAQTAVYVTSKSTTVFFSSAAVRLYNVRPP